MNSTKDKSEKQKYTEKRCPECFTVLKLDAKTCINCGQKVGSVNKFGLARRPFAWKAYLAFLISAILLGLYVKKMLF